MNRPAMLDHGYCKLPALYEQKDRDWGQFDGSVKNRLTRSVLAAIAIGATMQNLSIPEISNNVEQSIDFTLDLKGPKFTDVFPDQKLDPQRFARATRLRGPLRLLPRASGAGWQLGAWHAAGHGLSRAGHRDRRRAGELSLLRHSC